MGLLYKGVDISQGSPVEDWQTHGMKFVPPKGCRARKEKPRMIVLHWTGSENKAEQVFRTLNSRELGVHLVTQGTRVVQLCDLDLVALHAGVANEGSIGIENRNRGRPPSSPGHIRAVSTSLIHGQRMLTLDFTKDEVATIASLVTVMCDHFGIEKVIPGRGSEPHDAVLTRAELARWNGVLGHYQVSIAKTDPGSALLRSLVLDHGFRMKAP